MRRELEHPQRSPEFRGAFANGRSQQLLALSNARPHGSIGHSEHRARRHRVVRVREVGPERGPQDPVARRRIAERPELGARCRLRDRFVTHRDEFDDR